MRSLREAQGAFTAMLDDSPTDWPARHEREGVSAHPRFGVYRTGVHATLCDALAVIYPVVARLVDVRFFRQTTRQYLRACPATTGDLRGFGRDFPQFLASLRALRGLPYVADVARLEWALHDVHYAPEDSRHLDLGRLRQLTATDWPRLRFSLHRATGLVASRFPVLRIWQLNQDDAPARQDVDLDAGSERLLVVRTSDYDVGTHPLSVGEYTLLQAFAADHALEDAHGLVKLVDPTFDLARALGQFIDLGVVTDFRPDAPRDPV